MDDKMEECDGSRGWEEMIPDVLGLIFQKLPFKEILTVVPSVCKSWKRVVSGPYCWQEINILKWSSANPHLVERMLRMLVTRSSGSLRKLCVSGIPNDPVFSFIADHAGSLQTLAIPRSKISDSVVVQVAERLSSVTCLDISDCVNIGPDSIKAFGRHCKSLVKLSRGRFVEFKADISQDDDEAYAIARTMPKLQHLELYCLLVTTEGVLDILSSCMDLKYLDLYSCWEVKLDVESLKEKMPYLEVVGPHLYSDNSSDDPDLSDLEDLYMSDHSDSELEAFNDFLDFSDYDDMIYGDADSDLF